DQPIQLGSDSFSYMNYDAIVYAKAAIAIDYFDTSLGHGRFDRIMKKYFKEWKFKHPYPEDFRKLFEDETGMYLGWFFNHMLRTTWKLDYQIVKVSKDTMMIGHTAFTKITIKNGGKIAAEFGGVVKGPYSIAGMKNGKPYHTVWYDGFWGEMEVLFPQGEYDAFQIDPYRNLPESNRKNNTIRTKGMLKKVEPLRLQFLGSLYHPNKTQLFYLPI
ncbi:MAG: hypothetical protein IH946_02715, partial [Bacteroidetes bacterium]|nr:hypothetical protein [Bacteroidota bacterium]